MQLHAAFSLHSCTPLHYPSTALSLQFTIVFNILVGISEVKLCTSIDTVQSIFLGRCPNAETLSRYESPDCGAKRPTPLGISRGMDLRSSDNTRYIKMIRFKGPLNSFVAVKHLLPDLPPATPAAPALLIS
ncbi:hypothetical protein EVAR_51528_1 [Eumeta japonica]|uniref:Uncharacterized protein n=1 Tax=Eumeta variegata TaxID=151549 RepID=A0A4C1XFI6_EUMVA|nr:hypothetical protein EVAR_51528_1 [Eumeta japonica]